MLVQRVERRDLFLPARIDVLLQSKLALVPAGGVLLRPDGPRHLEGTAEQRAALEAALTPPVLEAAASLAGRFGFRSMDGLLPRGGFDVLVRLKWPEGWRNMLLRTWPPPDEPPRHQLLLRQLRTQQHRELRALERRLEPPHRQLQLRVQHRLPRLRDELRVEHQPRIVRHVVHALHRALQRDRDLQRHQLRLRLQPRHPPLRRQRRAD